MTPKRTELAEIIDGQMEVFYHWGQWKIMESHRRFLLALAGTQGGKTAMGPHWLLREIVLRGPGDYLVVTPTYPLLRLKALPEFRKVFYRWLKLGAFTDGGQVFEFSEAGAKRILPEYQPGIDDPIRVIFGHASNSESLESATALAAWLDEAGQKQFKVDSWEAILRRLSLAQGRVLLTTTIYNLGWLKQRLYDRWRAGDGSIEVSQFESIMNPNFPREEWDRAKGELPSWKFDMFYRARFRRPAGLIYESFNDKLHRVPRFAIPDDWQRFVGMDFGGVNTVALFYAQEPHTGRLFLYKEYHEGHRTAKEHVQEMLKDEPMIPYTVGGSKSEGQWRDEFAAGGLAVRPPVISDVEVGIDRVYGAHKRGEIVVFDDMGGYLDEKGRYSRKLDQNGKPTEEIEDKDEFHHMDAERYIIGWINDPNSVQIVNNPVSGYRG